MKQFKVRKEIYMAIILLLLAVLCFLTRDLASKIQFVN
jgi:uncharacterized membrane protein